MKLNKIDKTKEIEGVWEKYQEDAELLIARDGNPQYEQWVDKKLRPHIQQFRRKEDGVPLEIRQAIEREGRARFVLLDWKHIQFEEEGPMVEATVENKLQAFRQDPGFYDDVVLIANRQQRFHEEAKKADTENLSSTASGSSPTPLPQETANGKETSVGLSSSNLSVVGQ